MAEINLPEGVDAKEIQKMLDKWAKGQLNEDEIIFADFEHGANERIKVYKGFFKGRELLSIRKFWLDSDSGIFKPGKGVTFHDEAIPYIIEGLQKMQIFFEGPPEPEEEDGVDM